jgi:hypothetical protein
MSKVADEIAEIAGRAMAMRVAAVDDADAGPSSPTAKITFQHTLEQWCAGNHGKSPSQCIDSAPGQLKR